MDTVNGNEIYSSYYMAWDDEYFPEIIKLYEEGYDGKKENRIKKILDKYKSQWSSNKEFLNFYNKHFTK